MNLLQDVLKVTPEELAGFVQELRQLARTFTLDRPFVDIVGTGGDGACTLNLSTASALLAAASGIPVVKHGNRAASSLSGSADLMEAFGAELHLGPQEIQKLLQKTQFAFCFAPEFHPALKELREARKKIGVPTILNLAGPLLHPAGLDHLLLGVYKESLVSTMARALQILGTKRSLVFSNHGLDELSCIGFCHAILVTPEELRPLVIDPEKLGLTLCSLSDLKGGSPKFNRNVLSRVLAGEKSQISDTLILNAAAALFIYGPTESLEEAVLIARDVLKSGAALQLLENYCRETRKKKSLKEALQKKGVAVIAEIKRASPSRGHIADIPNVAERALLYIEGGASAISVLTNSAFEGSLEDLKQVSEALRSTPVPVLRKDFIDTRDQVIEAAEKGADALLLMVSRLQERTGEMLALAGSLGLEALVEVHTKEELAIAIAAGAEIIGVNQRDLSDFSMHPEKFKELAPFLPEECIAVAESGMSSLNEAYLLGYDAVLIGEALSRAEDPRALLEAL